MVRVIFQGLFKKECMLVEQGDWTRRGQMPCSPSLLSSEVDCSSSWKLESSGHKKLGDCHPVPIWPGRDL
jgi:hypothetical protein